MLPNKVVAVGRNYAEHAAELGHEVPEAPITFFKPTTSVIGSGDAIEYPSFSERAHHEAELAVVIGRMCREVPRERVRDVVLGYTCANDVTARDVQRREKQWARAKGFDTACPLGPWVETDVDPSRPHHPGDGQRRTAPARPYERHDPLRRGPGRPHLGGDDAAPGRRHPHRHPQGSGPCTSATRSPSPSKASALSPTR
ncbi:hypothetical protein SCALM49S_03599 [Streptomyces californicus]